MRVTFTVGGAISSDPFRDLMKLIEEEGFKTIAKVDYLIKVCSKPLNKRPKKSEYVSSLLHLFRDECEDYTDTEGDAVDALLQSYGLSYTSEVEPYKTSEGMIFNHHQRYWLPGMDDPQGFEYNQDSGILICQEDVLSALNDIKDLDDPQQWPLHINDENLKGEYVKARMKGISTSDFLTHYVKTMLGGELPELPLFIIK